MSLFRSRFAVLALWLFSLIAVGTLVHAQARNNTPAPQPTVFSGADIGFQAMDVGGKTVIGKLVVRINGQWRDTEFAPNRRVMPLTAR